MERRLLITGATGFVGRHLLEALRDAPMRITGTAWPPPAPGTDGPEKPRAEIRVVDLRRKESVQSLVRETVPDRVIHLAAVSNVRSSWADREETVQTNLLGTFHLFEALRHHAPGARALFISSSDVYGYIDAPDKILRESDPVQAINPYAYTKLAGELMADFYARVEGLDVVVARSFPHTGPGQSADFVCSDWARQIAGIERGAPAVVRVGNLDVKRDFNDVRDVVRAYLLLLDKGRRGEIYNVCSGRSVSLREVLNILLQAACFSRNARVEIEIDPAKLRKTDAPLLQGDRRKIQVETGWLPRIPLEKTLGDLLDDWRTRL